MERGSSRRVTGSSFPVAFLRIALVLGGLVLLYGAFGQRTADTALPRAGCLATLAAAVCEWRMLSWRLEAGRDPGERGLAERQDLQVSRRQLVSTAPWIHGFFLLSTLCWGFGDLLWD